MLSDAEKIARLKTRLIEAVGAWPEFDTEEFDIEEYDVSGTDLVDWFVNWRELAKETLAQVGE